MTWFIFAYFVLLNGACLALHFFGLLRLHRDSRTKLLNDMPRLYSGLEPGITIVLAASNAQAGIAASVHAMLQLAYPEFEIIVINDGSSDATLDVLMQEFALVPFPEAYRQRLKTSPIRAIFRSSRFYKLRVIDKVQGGKADALNAGINAARHPLVCVVDADSVLERGSLDHMVRPFLRDPAMVASAGTIRVLNGSEVQDGVATRIGLPRNLLALCQVVEYLRAFQFAPLGWSQLRAMLAVSGAFGLFRTEAVVEVGGYHTRGVGEGLDLVVRMHRVLRERGQLYRMEFVPDAICWSAVPDQLGTLRMQRIRWQHGLCEGLASHWRMMFSRRGGTPGWLAFPFMVLFEWLGPLIEVAGCIFLLFAAAQGLISWAVLATFVFLAIGLGILLSASALLLEEMSFHLYPKLRQVALLGLVAVAENFGYRQLNGVWRLIGLMRWALGRRL